MVFSGVCSNKKWGKNYNKKQHSQHTSKYKPNGGYPLYPWHRAAVMSGMQVSGIIHCVQWADKYMQTGVWRV